MTPYSGAASVYGHVVRRRHCHRQNARSRKSRNEGGNFFLWGVELELSLLILVLHVSCIG